MKFSIIVPIYNVEKYIKKCMESIENQTYKNYEVLLINDGSPDNSEKIIKEFINKKKNYLYYKKQNGGLSDARNYGAKKATGDYLLFVDADDYISPKLLEELNNSLDKSAVDVIKFNYQTVYENSDKVEKHDKTNFFAYSPDKAIPLLLRDDILEPAWLYCYKRAFWNEKKFKYFKGRVHEDYGLTPLVIMEANSLSSIDYVGYNYLNRDGSITNSPSIEKLWKRFNDTFDFWKENIQIIMESNNINTNNKKILCSYYSNGIISKIAILDNANSKKASKIVKQNKVYKYLAADNLMRFIKKAFIMISPYAYVNLIIRRTMK